MNRRWRCRRCRYWYWLWTGPAGFGQRCEDIANPRMSRCSRCSTGYLTGPIPHGHWFRLRLLRQHHKTSWLNSARFLNRQRAGIRWETPLHERTERSCSRAKRCRHRWRQLLHPNRPCYKGRRRCLRCLRSLYRSAIGRTKELPPMPAPRRSLTFCALCLLGFCF